MYSFRSGLILAFHGCDEEVALKIAKGEATLRTSQNKYDWLGHGAYFWENSPGRALEFAESLKGRLRGQKAINKPAVIGAVINLGYCLDLLDIDNLELLREGYEVLMTSYNNSEISIPKNISTQESGDLLIRDLDCAVIESLHSVRKDAGLNPFDSVRGDFFEGEELYPNAGFREKDHIQICVRNPNCIKGFFLPRDLNSRFSRV